MQTQPCVIAGGPEVQGVQVHRVADPRYLAALLGVIRDLSKDDCKSTRFPGPNPVSLDTSHFSKLGSEPYYVCEKTDGVRYLMVCCTMDAPAGLRERRATINVCALVDRALSAYLFPVEHLPGAMYQGSLLDGELAFNKKSGRWEYLVFDAMCVSGVPVLDCHLRDRLEAVHRVLRVYAEFPCDRDPAALRVKNFFACSRMADFESALPGLREAYDIDGVILTPAARPVAYGRHYGMFKLKFDARHTVDFLVGPDGRGLSVFDAGSHVQVGTLSPGQAAPPGSIAECQLHAPHTSLWTVVTLRTDKTTANDMYTYQKTMLNMRENLTLARIKGLFLQTV
jgi:hypothetical protein